ncbi:MAG: class I SAM-dependent methyltransferase [Solirubrobacteraceae bacterium]
MSEHPLLIHSLQEFSSLILPALEAAEARTILEIGSEAGDFTRELCLWAGERGGTVTTVEPMPLESHRQLERKVGLKLIEGKSPQVLDGLPPFDAYIIDGDHNYWCVSAELRHAFAQQRSPLVIAHDVAWPCARRDQYYDPADVPPAERHPFSYDGGVDPDHAGLIFNGGFRGADKFAYACREGEPRSGVLTAVEDFIAIERDVRFLRVPCIFGLGVLFRGSAPWAARIEEIVGPLHENELLAALERNRIELFLRFIDPHRFHSQQDATGAALIAAQQREIDALQGELAQLRLTATRQET